MLYQGRRAMYASLWVLALAFGWIEAAVVVYLREAFAPEVALQGKDYWVGLQVTLASLPSRLVAVEVAREACTILLLGAVAWLAGRRPADRAGAFLLTFGIWDLTYYAALKLVVGWPDALTAWDILFLIPAPWVAPVWAPALVATIFVTAGSYLFWTADRARRYRWPDIGVLLVSALLTIAAFLVESRAAIDSRTPERFPVWLFGAGVALGAGWFLWVERGGARGSDTQTPVGSHGRHLLRAQSQAMADQGEAFEAPAAMLGPRGTVNSDPVIWEHTKAKRQLEALQNEAAHIGERFSRLAQSLTAHPARMIVGSSDTFIENPSDWDVVPGHPLPSIERLAALTSDIRACTEMVEQLRERLILMGRGDLVEQSNGFFH